MSPALPASTTPKTRLGRFFYNEEVPFGLALVRILLPLSILGSLIPRWQYARELYSTDGATAPLWVTYGYSEMLPEIPGTLAVALFSMLIFFLFTASLGWCTRLSLFIAFLLYTYFTLIDAVSTMTKYSVIASHVLLILSLSQSGSVWSIDSWLSRKKQARHPWPGDPAIAHLKCPVWPQRLMQLLLAAVYFGAAITKMKTPAFFSGDQLQTWMITNVNFDNPIGEQIAMHPILLVIFAYITIVWEILFLFLAWRGLGRVTMIFIGTIFHVLTIFTLGLYIFPAICISIYFSFLDEDDLRKIAARFRRLKRTWGFASSRKIALPQLPTTARFLGGFTVPSQALLALILAFVTFVAIETEYRLDRYGIRGPEGPYALKELDADFVENVMLAPTTRVQAIDTISFFETGTTIAKGILIDKRTVFSQGETLMAQCTLNSPHEDMWVECKIQDSRGRTIDRFGQVVSREMLRANYYYNLSEAFEPGEYQMVLTSAGKEVIRKRITLKPRITRSNDSVVETAVAN